MRSARRARARSKRLIVSARRYTTKAPNCSRPASRRRSASTRARRGGCSRSFQRCTGNRPVLQDWTFWAAAAPAVILFGLSKSGFSGLGALGIPIMSLAISPVQAAAITLPILVVQDWVGVYAFRREVDKRNLAILMPAAGLGVLLAWAMAAKVNE